MDHVIISIIMPVYNTGSYLEESISSVLGQTFKAFELICVDDESTDKETLRILHKFHKNCEKVSVLFQKEQTGAGEARNRGLKAAKGTYVMFLDADDLFDPHLLENLYDTISKKSADFCVCGYESFYVEDGVRHRKGIHMPRTLVPKTEGIFCLNDLPDDALTYWSTAPWNKLFKKNFLNENEIYFQSLPSSNDVFFSCMSAIKAKKIVYAECGKPLVFYRENIENQISARRNPLNLLCAVKYLMEVLEEQGQIRNSEGKLLCFLLKNAVYEMQHCSYDKKNEEFYIKLKEYIRNHFNGYHFNGYHFNKNHFKDSYYRYCMDNLSAKSYESKWFMLVDDYDVQLEERKEQLISILINYKEIVLWGMGKRGAAFQRFCRKNDVALKGIADKRNQNIGEKTDLGYNILDTSEVFLESDLVVASNSDVYQSLAANEEGRLILDLSEYCPF